MTKSEKRELNKQLKRSGEFLNHLYNVLEASPKLRELWDRLDLSILDPGALKEDVLDVFMMVYEHNK
jgi:hypothetical protein